MDATNRVIEDTQLIQTAFRRLLEGNEKIAMAFKTERREFMLLSVDKERIALGMDRSEFEKWKLSDGDKVSLSLKDRGFKFDSVTTCVGSEALDGMSACVLHLPRSLRRSDTHRLVDFAPEAPLPATFTNARNTILEGQVTGFGREGVELTLKDARQKVQEHFRMGEESTVDVQLEGDVRLMASARVAYLDENVVGLKFGDKVDKDLLLKYRNWLEGQERQQIQRDREGADSGPVKKTPRTSAPDLPPPRLWTDRDPMILVLTESEDFARRIAEGLGRKFGFISLDYIKGKVKAALKDQVGPEDWGRFKLIIVHNRLRLSSPLELTRQIVEGEKCPLPVLCAGSEEDLELKRNRALAAGAVDYLPVDPFKILSVMKKLDETLVLFQ